MFKLPEQNFVFLETNRFDKDNRRSFLFSDPLKVICCYRLEDIKSAFSEVEDSIRKGYYIAGFISYEAGLSFEENLIDLNRDSFGFPLLWFGVYKAPYVFTHREDLNLCVFNKGAYSVKNIRPNISRKDYVRNVEKIKDFIRKGVTYQVNYTFKYKFNFSGSIFRFYKDLKAKQSVSYAALIKIPDFSILSLSPELFFRKNNQRIEVKPMKGTIDRGKTLKEDLDNIKFLEDSIKNRSENVMIVDLLRNDLGRISRAGTVKTERLFKVEKYETLFQMISIVKSVLRKNITLYELFRAIFPSGSVTGAPKISTMRIIDSLEKEPRYVYTGSVGFFAPDGEAVFNVAIRTAVVDNNTCKGEMGVGSGIVYDSDPHKEFAECKLKADFFIARARKDFKLLETILWHPEGGYFLLDRHLDRLASSSEYFSFRYNRQYVMRSLKEVESRFKADCRYKVRVLLGRDGRLNITFSRLKNNLQYAKVRFSNKKTLSNDIFLYHKTSCRELYDEEYKRWNRKGYFDIIFTNEKDQVTEGAISNIIVRKGRFYYTPPVECGILEGVFRSSLLENKRFLLKEKILYRHDIESADEIYMVNSVRGMVKVRL